MIGIIGLGRMGGAVAQRLAQDGHKVVGFDLDPQTAKALARFGVQAAESVIDLATQVNVAWIMVPAGKIVDQVIEQLLPNLKPESTIIDAGNSNFKNSIKRAELCKKYQINFLDCGTSGGVHGREHGFCLMIGGDKNIYQKLKPYFKSIATPNGYAYVGPVGAGHYVKMIHNGIEYALLQSYAEGFDLIKNNQNFPNLNLAQLANLWQHGSVIRSFILQLAYNVFDQDQDLSQIKSIIGGGQTGRLTVEEAHSQGVPVPLIEHSLRLRDVIKVEDDQYAAKVVAMLRNQFGGHKVEEF